MSKPTSQLAQEAVTASTCPSWCEQDDHDVYELGDRVHLGPLVGVRATLHDNDPANTLDEASMVVTLNQRPGHPVHVVLSDANGRVSSNLLLDEAEQLSTSLAELVAAGRGKPAADEDYRVLLARRMLAESTAAVYTTREAARWWGCLEYVTELLLQVIDEGSGE